MFITNFSPVLSMRSVSSALRTMPEPSNSWCLAGRVSTAKMSFAAESIVRVTVTCVVSLLIRPLCRSGSCSVTRWPTARSAVPGPYPRQLVRFRGKEAGRGDRRGRRAAMRPSPSRDPRPAPNLAQVEALIAIVDYGSFTAAAEVLRISQPSLSRRVRALEEALGTRLFLPVGRRRELTDTGRRIVAAGRRALGEMSSIEAMVASARELATGSLRVTGLPSLVSPVLTDRVGVFHREHPGVRI